MPSPRLAPHRAQDSGPQHLSLTLPSSLSFFQTKSEFTVEFSVSDHQGVSSPRSPCCPGRVVPGPRGWKEANTDSLPFSCQVITRKVNIQVGDVNDNAPTFHNQPYSVRIPEVGAAGSHLEDAGDLLLGVGWSQLEQGHVHLFFFCPHLRSGACFGQVERAGTSEGVGLSASQGEWVVGVSCL